MAYKIYKITDCAPVDYAAEELKKYLRMMMPECGEVKIERACGCPPANDGFVLGTMQDFGLDVSEAEIPDLDDIIHIDTTDTAGIIAGSNPRSVLIATYRFLRENGCRWLYPGVDGEYIPMQNIHGVKFHKAADMRYRGWCNEGSESQQCMLETIEFSPKIGLNVYMIEFFNPHFYYDYYYSHINNEANRLPEPVSHEQVLQWKRMCESEMEKRGLEFHDIGHGWSAEAFGINTDDAWKAISQDSVPEESRKYLAEINGKRELFGGSPMNTQFCMSNPEARKIFVDKVVDYAKKHTNVTYLHVWMADNFNNHCECEECCKMIPTDWYVKLLNEIDDELTRLGLDTRIVFAIGFETAWAPIKEKLHNSDRFLGLHGPLGRRYTRSFTNFVDESTLPVYKRNNIVQEKNIETFFTLIKKWRDVWSGPLVCYEYHFYIYHMYDVGTLYYANRIYEDIQNLERAGFNGYIEDGSQRPFFPNGLNMFIYAETLFDRSKKFEDLVDEYYSYAYGEHKNFVMNYMKELSAIFEFPYMNGMMPTDKSKGDHYDPARLDSFKRVPEITKKAREYILANYKMKDRVKTVSMLLLLRHTEYAEQAGEVMQLVCQGLTDEANERAEDFYASFGRHEAEIERYYDHGMCVMGWRHRIAKGVKRNTEAAGI